MISSDRFIELFYAFRCGANLAPVDFAQMDCFQDSHGLELGPHTTVEELKCKLARRERLGEALGRANL